jgi:hypothetical protein
MKHSESVLCKGVQSKPIGMAAPLRDQVRVKASLRGCTQSIADIQSTQSFHY